MKSIQTKAFYAFLCACLLTALAGTQSAHAVGTCYVSADRGWLEQWQQLGKCLHRPAVLSR